MIRDEQQKQTANFKFLMIKLTKFEIKDDKDIDKRNSSEIRYSFDLKFS